jgi:hypothetical protein
MQVRNYVCAGRELRTLRDTGGLCRSKDSNFSTHSSLKVFIFFMRLCARGRQPVGAPLYSLTTDRGGNLSSPKRRDFGWEVPCTLPPRRVSCLLSRSLSRSKEASQAEGLSLAPLRSASLACLLQKLCNFVHKEMTFGCNMKSHCNLLQRIPQR